MKKALFSIILALVLLGLNASYANAGTQPCIPTYGGGQICPKPGNILVDKTVKDPATGAFVDNLGINNTKFDPEQLIEFKITVKNVGNSAIADINVRDIFPQFVKFVAGKGSFDENTNSLNFSIPGLAPNETMTFDVNGQVFAIDRLPQDKGIVCVVNQAVVSHQDRQAFDSSEVCIQRRVLPAQVPAEVPGQQIPGKEIPPVTKGGKPVFPPGKPKVTPPTGPEMLGLIALLPSGLAGVILRRKTGRK